MPAAYRRLERCRIGGGEALVPVLDLGEQVLTGVFPRSAHAPVTRGPLQLVRSPASGLVQLGHSYAPDEMYGENYGYRSGLNHSMVRHLNAKIAALEHFAGLESGATVLDIGSNDATGLKAYSVPGLRRVGVDPTGAKFRSHYPDDITLIADFFSAAAVRRAGAAPAAIVTSIAMFYDLEDPIGFAREVEQVLAPGGIWHFEQSYLPSMLRLNSYDTVCHEHLEYYSLAVVQRILDAAGMRAVAVALNTVNGGSFAVTAVRRGDARAADAATIEALLAAEAALGLETPAPYEAFADRVAGHRAELRGLLAGLAAEGRTVLGYGASTKGNVVLQYCGLTTAELPAIAEVNADKFGCFTPGTGIPIVSEAAARAMRPDYFLVLPWHFRDGIVAREAAFRAAGGRLIFPFPEIDIV